MSEDRIKIEAQAEKREKTIVRTSIIGIVTNVMLVAFKMFVGLLSNSIAIILDAVNNLSDALSSLVTIIGAKLGSKAPDRKHPLGYGRIEYLSTLIVAALVLYAGLTSLVESVKKIIHPEEANYTAVSLIIISVAIVVKLVLGLYVKKQGKKVNSGALVASGSDALFDAIISLSVLVSAIIYLVFGLSLEAYVGVLISVMILKAGLEMLMETINDLIGKRDDAETIKKIKAIICEEEKVRGAYDLILYNYGPNKNYGSVHIELPDNMCINEVDQIARRIETNVYMKTGVTLTGIGVYSYNTSDDEAAKMRDTIREKILAHDWALQTHGFYADTENKTARFDVVITFNIPRKKALEILYKDVEELYPDYSFTILPDADLSDVG
ncbi:MAG: cation diffusion facilitator family transporter [Clostridia bacterium]|nr:cation diffusion facilitator family transporter [Clostridia bacterium]